MPSDRLADLRVNAVQQSTIPPYAYTVGLAQSAGCELICAGALRYNVQEIDSILRACAREMVRVGPPRSTSVSVEGLGDFVIGHVHREWLTELIPGQLRGAPTSTWYQVVPTCPDPTVDTPDLGMPRSAERDPAWRWLDHPWDLDAPNGSHLVTTLEVLSQRNPLTIFRWELDQWEALDRPAVEIDQDNARVVPLGVLAEIVEDWSPFLNLNVGEGLQLVGGHWIPA